ncbi:hypothetical protein ACWXVT_00615 [Mycoplasma sp. 1573]
MNKEATKKITNKSLSKIVSHVKSILSNEGIEIQTISASEEKNMLSKVKKSIDSMLSNINNASTWKPSKDLQVKDSVIIDKEKGYSINFDSSDIGQNSKDIHLKLIEINTKLKYLVSQKDALSNLNQGLIKASIAIKTAAAVAAGISVASFVGSFLFPPLAAVATTAGWFAGICGAISLGIDIAVSKRMNNINNIIKLAEEQSSSLKNGAASLMFGNVLNKSIFEKISNLASLSNIEIAQIGTKIGSLALSTISFGLDIKDVVSEFQKFYEINSLVSEIRNEIQNLNKISKNYLDKVRWVVIDETKQYGNYSEEGYGGKNLVIKNIKTGEIFNVNDLINKSQFELRLMGLQKVNDSIKGWYVRTIKNNTKIDNLG